MKFPLLSISTPQWTNFDSYYECLLMDPYVYSRDEQVFSDYWYSQKFCDCEGNVYRVVDKVPPEEKWRRIFSFLPNAYRMKMIFEMQDERWEIERLRKFLLDRLEEYEKFQEVDFSEWKQKVREGSAIADFYK